MNKIDHITLQRDKFGMFIDIDGKIYCERNASERAMFQEFYNKFTPEQRLNIQNADPFSITESL